MKQFLKKNRNALIIWPAVAAITGLLWWITGLHGWWTYLWFIVGYILVFAGYVLSAVLPNAWREYRDQNVLSTRRDRR